MLAGMAAWGFVSQQGLAGNWGLLAGAGAFAFIGIRSQQALARGRHELVRHLSEMELLQGQLEQQSRSVDALADGLEVAVFMCDSKANVLYANRRAKELFSFENPIGRTLLAITLSYDLEQLVMGALSEKETRRAEVSFTYPDERMGLATAWVADDDGRRAFLSIYEITDLRRLERVRQDFVANVSHELRTPMTLIRAMAETLLDESPPTEETAARYLPRIISEVDRLSTITQDLLILSAAESNPVRKHPCDIAEVFRTVLVQLESKADEKGLALAYVGPDNLNIEANKAQMTQVALNLIDNAINYTPSGSVTVNVIDDVEEVEVRVTDTGIGIASEHHRRVFERFYRIDKSRSRATGGTGLGLSIVKHIVEAHGGSVRVESSLNQGTTFAVRLPVGEVPVEEPV